MALRDACAVLVLLAATGPAFAAGPALTVDAAADRHAISPLVYGINFADEALAAELGLPLRRWGGNATTRYSWRNDTSNRASDWYFENIPNDNPDPGALPDGSSSDRFVEQDRRTGTKTLLTVPLVGWTPKSRGYACGFSVARYGAQQSVDPWRPDCGNGRRGDGSEIAGNDPADTSSAIGPPFVRDWVAHLVARYGAAREGGVPFYDLDNEPELWNDTHRDVHPQPASYDELRDRAVLYAPAVKEADPGALTLGPVAWGWTAYFYSALDWEPGGDWWNHPQDRNAHGGVPFVEWYLAQMSAWERAHGLRVLDVLDLHYYPQAAGVALSPAGDAATQALRLRSTRALWDPAYVDESWIGEAVRLLPRMREWVATRYPGTKLAITEYNWGGLESINGALAQADVLGIFGREGLHLAALWSPPAATDPGAFAFRLYRNVDGAGGRFGNTGVRATSGDPSRVAIYAALRGDGWLTIALVNKSTSAETSALSVLNFAPSGAARVYRYSAADLSRIVREADLPLPGGAASVALPASSLTLLAIPGPVDFGPGEAGPAADAHAQLRVARYDRLTGSMRLTWQAACDAVDHTAYWGNLAQVSSYAYAGRACHLGNAGYADVVPGAGSVFLLVVGNDGAREGSYGRGGSGAERPAAGPGGGCWYAQAIGVCP